MTRTQSSLHLKHAGEAEADHDYSVWLALTDQAPKLDLSISSFFAGTCRPSGSDAPPPPLLSFIYTTVLYYHMMFQLSTCIQSLTSPCSHPCSSSSLITHPSNALLLNNQRPCLYLKKRIKIDHQMRQ